MLQMDTLQVHMLSLIEKIFFSSYVIIDFLFSLTVEFKIC